MVNNHPSVRARVLVLTISHGYHAVSTIYPTGLVRLEALLARKQACKF